ncbi:hypothetical protein [Vibrio astriarenae]|uniref:hypothetical protein n=1 Tax=Vibrio astriarenae TaxID=1481923 RepID=UPI0037370E78
MENMFNVMQLAGAIAGGFLGATFGALVAFVFTGFAILVGIAIVMGSGDPTFLNLIGLGPFFGPHISFAAGVAASAYAAKKGWLESGRDIVTPLVSLGKPQVLLVGAAFGLFGFVVQQSLMLVDGLGNQTDSVALTVVISAIVVRLMFGKSGIVGKHCEGKTGLKRFQPCKEHAWLPYQDSFSMSAVLGLFVGAMSAYAAYELLTLYPQPEAQGVLLFGFAISAISLLFLGMNVMVPATHHITAVSAVAVSLFMGTIENQFMVITLGAVCGLLASLLGQLFARFWLIRADTHIDPPASAIWPMTSALIVISVALQ